MPRMTISSAMTLARTGRSIKNLAIIGHRSRRQPPTAEVVTGTTVLPGSARMMPPTTTRSFGSRPLSMMRSPPSINSPGSTWRCSTTFLSLTISR